MNRSGSMIASPAKRHLHPLCTLALGHCALLVIGNAREHAPEIILKALPARAGDDLSDQYRSLFFFGFLDRRDRGWWLVVGGWLFGRVFASLKEARDCRSEENNPCADQERA